MKARKPGRPAEGLSEVAVFFRTHKAISDGVKEVAEQLGKSASFVWRQAAAAYLKAHGVDVYADDQPEE